MPLNTPTPPQFTPNTSCGPCVYCGESSEGQPQELVSCELCRRPLHLLCLKSPPQSSLLGDNFFLVTCGACSDGEEVVQRADMSE
ncbi:hypothetical protein E2C01_023727 [Portunus trituberculatus]|uniref:Zinc finger PHD-type domain-containing protein n=1 Tax=Portunus trituberculatus TaxID=210409 RepID=A0A5B7E8P5_PORTR|nr:hypothetical protein [Portunus trituberculatus]